MFLEDLVGYCYCVRCPISSPSVGHVTVGVIILEATGFSGLDVLLESLLYLENFFSWPVVDHVAVSAAVSEAAGLKCLDVLRELPLELAYDICLVLNFLKLFGNRTFGRAIFNC